MSSSAATASPAEPSKKVPSRRRSAVRCDRSRGALRRPYARGRLVDGIGGLVHGDHLRAFGGEEDRCGAADAAAGAGHDGDFS